MKSEPIIAFNFPASNYAETTVSERIKYIKQEFAGILEDEKRLTVRKAMLEGFRIAHTQLTPIKWVTAIMDCLESDLSNKKSFIKRASDVSLFIGKKYEVVIDTKMKNKIATTLSKLHRQGEIGRTNLNGASYYGYRNIFEKDLITLKNKYEIGLFELENI